MRVVIADDERLARQRLRRLLSPDPEVEIVAECTDGKQALEAIVEELPDLALLDIQMPGLDGFQVVEALPGNVAPVIVFVTAYDEHAVRAFEACALDYLLKPISATRILKMISRVRDHLARANHSLGIPPAPGADSSHLSRRFMVRSGQRTSIVTLAQIDWIEADGNYAILHSGKQNHLLRETMSTLEAELPKEFARVSRSAIVQLARVKEIRAQGGHHVVVLQDDSTIPLTRSIREMEAQLRDL